MTAMIRYEVREDKVAELYLPEDFSPLSAETQDSFATVLQAFATQKCKGLLLRSSAPQVFCQDFAAEELASLSSEEQATQYAQRWQHIAAQIQELPFPTVCLLQGACFGVGLELALACDWRIGTLESETQLGFLETQAGSMPKAGATYRLPRLIGIQAALDLLLTGRIISGEKACRTGLLDLCVPTSFLEAQVSLLIKKGKRRKLRSPASKATGLSHALPQWALEGNTLGRKRIFKKTAELIETKTQGLYPASYAILEAVSGGFDHPEAKVLENETRGFARLSRTEAAQSLSHIRLLRKRKALLPTFENTASEGSPVLGLLGATPKQGALAALAIERGFRVWIVDPSQEAVGLFLQGLHATWRKKVEKKEIPEYRIAMYMTRVLPSDTLQGFQRAVLVLDDLPVQEEMRWALWKELRQGVGYTGWLVQLAAPNPRLKTPAALAPWTPLHILGASFVEYPKGEDQESLATVLRQMGLFPIAENPLPHFFSQRISDAYRGEAKRLAAQGISYGLQARILQASGCTLTPSGILTHLEAITLEATSTALSEAASVGISEREIANGYRRVLFDESRACVKDGTLSHMDEADWLLVDGFGVSSLWFSSPR
jgi:3-hydroxyacyl-CoA dehydrogenase/enoyl-CoA hydratase/3-hydroxybutyryl-CoA epimerase